MEQRKTDANTLCIIIIQGSNKFACKYCIQTESDHILQVYSLRLHKHN